MQDSPVRILLVDDDEDDYIITRDLISRIGAHRHVLDWESQYGSALEVIKRREHDVYLLDYRLGELTGLELLREAQKAGCRSPMILLTGQGDREVDMEAMRAGAADYLVKGQLTADMLERAIRYAIEDNRAEETLRRERDLISRITETSPVGIVVADHEGKITFANHRAEEVLALEKGAIASGSCNVLDWRPTDPEGNPLPVGPSPLKRVLDKAQPVQDIRYAIDRAENRRVLLSTNAAPLCDASGKADGMVVTVEDITERLSLEAQLRQSQKMESVGQLAAGVAHDINNILTVIQGHVGLLLNVVAAGTPTEKSLKQVSAAADRAARFIRQLLTFSRKQVIQTKILEVNTVLHNLENMLSRLLGEDIALELRFGNNIPRVEADTGMVEQVILNLAVNSRDAMPKGGKLTLETSCVNVDESYERNNPEARAGEFVCLTVTDNGCGIDPKNLQKIFEPFFTTKETSKGTGLGLATVYGIVKQHRGWIEVQSQLNVGTTFRIFLPGIKKASSFSTDIMARTDAVRGGGEALLLVEDEGGLRDLVQQILQEYQYNVVVASSGTEALRIWDEHKGQFDLLLTDMVMPGGMTGRDLAEELKKRKPTLKVVYSSGYSSELIGKDFGHGNTAFLAKPYMPRQLARLVRECLDKPLKTGDSPLPQKTSA